MRIISDSDEETDKTFQEIKIGADGALWSRFEDGFFGILPFTCIFKDVKGPTGCVTRNMMADNVISTFLLIIDNHVMKHIRMYTEAEGCQILNNKTSLQKLLALEFHMYVELTNQKIQNCRIFFKFKNFIKVGP